MLMDESTLISSTLDIAIAMASCRCGPSTINKSNWKKMYSKKKVIGRNNSYNWHSWSAHTSQDKRKNNNAKLRTLYNNIVWIDNSFSNQTTG